MPRYVIERAIPEIGSAERDALREASQKSNSVLATMKMKAENKNIQWEHSHMPTRPNNDGPTQTFEASLKFG